MEKMPPANPRRPNKAHPGNKRKQPLKVVYITNPIKVKTSASRFRALVQELTGQDASYSSPESVADAVRGRSRRDAADADADAVKAVAEDNVNALDEVTAGRPTDGEVAERGSDPYADALDDGALYGPRMTESFAGLMGSNLLHDALKSLDAV